MRVPHSTPHRDARTHRPAVVVRTNVVCVPADVDTADLRHHATETLAVRGLPTAGVLPHFTTRTRRTRKLIDRWRGRTSGGPIRLLDLDAMRRAAVAAAAAEWALWARVVDDTRPATPFWSYVERHTADPDRYPVSRAQADYLAQPRIVAMAAHNALPNRPLLLPTAAVEAFQAGYTTYLNLAWLAAVPADGFAPVTGGWLCPASQRLRHRLDYLAAANAHLNHLTPQTRLVAVASRVQHRPQPAAQTS